MKEESQKKKLFKLLSDGLPHNVDEIIRVVYPNEGRMKTPARVGARVHDIKADGHEINGWKDSKNQSIYWYQMTVQKEPKQEPLFRVRSFI
jgi:hypothetical protein